MSISIHTPARGVTFYFEDIPTDTVISIHTPARGVTLAVINKKQTT